VDYSFLLAVLRNLSVQAGNVPEAYVQVLGNMFESGLAVPFTAESVEIRREKIGIPKISKPNVEQIKKLIELTNMDYLLKENKTGGL